MSTDASSEIIVNEEAKPDLVQQQEEPKPDAYAWFVLFIIFFVRAVHQLHRQIIGFAFGYQGLGAKAGDPKYMISTAYPQMNLYFGLVSSFVFSFPYSILGV